MKNKNHIKIILKQHLINFGFKFFDNYNKYDLWKENYLQKSNISKEVKKEFLIFLEKNLINKNYTLSCEFYDLIAQYKTLMLITHSMKSNEILNSGVSIINELEENRNILDIGCNSGYLTSFYAKVLPNSNFIGVDKSKNSILKAKKIYNSKKYSNLLFSNNYKILNKYKFNLISDTQCLCNLKKKELLKILDLINNYLYSNIKIVSVSNLRNELQAKSFFSCLLEKNFFVKSISPLVIQTLYGIVTYTKIIFTKKQEENEYDLKSYFKNLRKKISIVNLMNLN